jgi:hypothetical protein
MATAAITDTMFQTAIDQVVDAHLDNDGDESAYDPLKEALLEQVIALVNQIRAKHASELTKAKKENTDTVKVKKSTSKAKSGEPRKANTYSQFVGLLKFLKPEGKDDEKIRSNVPDLASFEIIVGEHFKDKSAACAKRYDDYKDQLLFGGSSIEGQTMTLSDLYDVITSAKSLDSGFANGMTRAGLMWGLTSEADHKKILELADGI